MLDIKFIRENPEKVKRGVESKNAAFDPAVFQRLDERRRAIIQEGDEQKNKRNLTSEEIARKKKAGQNADPQVTEMKQVGERIRQLDEELKTVESDLEKILHWIPNLPHASVPIGKDPSANVEIRRWGDPSQHDFPARNHLELGEKLDLLDFKRGSKVAGSGFPLYKGTGARLERALINFMLDLHTQKHGYREIFPPFLVNPASMFGTGQLPKMAEDMYHIPTDDLFLIPTAEVPVTNIHRDEVLDQAELPVRYAAYSACFRREAGSYGKETRGFLRVHQFNKVELVKLVLPETSYQEHELLLGDAERVLQILEIPYRIINLCSGDLSFAAAKCYDIEIWASVEKRWLEVSSCSNFEDFQARRANIRFKRGAGSRPEFVHTLNASGVATSRLMVAILENYQTDEGTVRVPKALQSYLGLEVIK